MKYFLGLLLAFSFLNGFSQETTPKGYKKSSLVLVDSTRLDGYVKEYLSDRASVVFIPTAGSRKKEYRGDALLSLKTEDVSYLCIHGDLFKVISGGDLDLLQKSSDASGIPTYNGSEAVFTSGTPGRINDYFVYDTRSRQLSQVTRKNYRDVTGTIFSGYSPSIAMAAEPEGDMNQLRKAVELYNSRTNR